MKAKFISIFAILLFIGFNSFGQQYSWGSITTHNQTSVTAGTLTSSDYNWIEKLQIKNDILNSYNVTYESQATHHYNCHFWAWFNTEQYPNNLYWVNYPSNNWLDYSFVQTPTESYPGKVTYSYQSDTATVHSAITTATSGIYRSKWGPLCGIIHAWDECPYYNDGATERKYYARFVINGQSNISCVNGYFGIPNTSGEGYSISWSTNEYLNIESYTNSYVEVSPIASGQGVVGVGVHKNGYFSAHGEPKYVTVYTGTTQAPTGINSTELCSNSEVDFWVVDNINPSYLTTYNWDLWDGDGEIINGQGTTRITVATGGTGYLPITVTANTNCGESEWYFEEFYIDYCGGKSSFTLSPNPTTDILKVTTQSDFTDRPEIEIYSSKMIKVQAFPLLDKEQTINVSSLPKGMYIVVINAKGHRSFQKFVKN
jgi:hypothetical protein